MLEIPACLISITPVQSKLFEKIVAEKFNQFWEGNSLLHSSQFPYRRSLETCDAVSVQSTSSSVFISEELGKYVMVLRIGGT